MWKDAWRRLRKNRMAVVCGGFTIAMVLFCGMIVFNIFSESFTRSPTLILAQPSFVKKVVFPLEVLPVVTLRSALPAADVRT